MPAPPLLSLWAKLHPPTPLVPLPPPLTPPEPPGPLRRGDPARPRLKPCPTAATEGHTEGPCPLSRKRSNSEASYTMRRARKGRMPGSAEAAPAEAGRASEGTVLGSCDKAEAASRALETRVTRPDPSTPGSDLAGSPKEASHAATSVNPHKVGSPCGAAARGGSARGSWPGSTEPRESIVEPSEELRDESKVDASESVLSEEASVETIIEVAPAAAKKLLPLASCLESLPRPSEQIECGLKCPWTWHRRSPSLLDCLVKFSLGSTLRPAEKETFSG